MAPYSDQIWVNVSANLRVGHLDYSFLYFSLKGFLRYCFTRFQNYFILIIDTYTSRLNTLSIQKQSFGDPSKTFSASPRGFKGEVCPITLVYRCSPENSAIESVFDGIKRHSGRNIRRCLGKERMHNVDVLSKKQEQRSLYAKEGSPQQHFFDCAVIFHSKRSYRSCLRYFVMRSSSRRWSFFLMDSRLS